MTVSRHQAVGAYQSWQPPSFDAAPAPCPDTPDRHEAGREAIASEGGGADNPAVHLPTAEEIERIYEQARHEGHESGRAEGLAAGYEEGRTLARAEAGRLAQLVNAVEASLQELDQQVAQEIVTLAIAVARQIVGDAVASDPGAVLHVVREALLQLPQNRVRIHVHPLDAAGIREYLGDQLDHGHHHLLEDEAIARGGCRLESSGCEVDATMETRWRRVVEGMGRDAGAWREAE